MVDFSQLKVALVTDWMTEPGGADRLLLQLKTLFPNSDILTTLYFPEKYTDSFKIPGRVISSFMGKIPFRKYLAKHLSILAPFAFESFDLTQYDLVISLSAGAAKGVITAVDQPHVAIILTPPRGLWENERNLRGRRLGFLYGMVAPLLATVLRMWDYSVSKRLHRVISISKFIRKKVSDIYGIESQVIYPGIDSFWFMTDRGEVGSEQSENQYGDYFLIVSRLYQYKKVDVAIRAVIRSGKKLLIVGSGPDQTVLQKVAGKSELIHFLGNVSDQQLRELYRNAKAFLFCGVEDFGYVAVEAMATGCPVLHYGRGGVAEIVGGTSCGSSFQSEDQLVELLNGFDRKSYDPDRIVRRAKQFTYERFREKIGDYIAKELNLPSRRNGN